MSWYQAYPELSMRLIAQYGGGKDSQVIDVGGGTSSLVEVLVNNSYHDITVLDISGAALSRAAEHLGPDAGMVKWVESDVLAFRPDAKFDIWHDRATFHFLTNESDIDDYVENAARALRTDGLLIVATFSEQGPERCSNLPVHRYSQQELTARMEQYFTRIECVNTDHTTPRNTTQNFTYCAFRRNQTIVSHKTSEA